MSGDEDDVEAMECSNDEVLTILFLYLLHVLNFGVHKSCDFDVSGTNEGDGISPRVMYVSL